MTRLLSIAATLLALASLRCLADDTAPALPAPNEAARARNVADDPNASTKSDQAKPSSLDSDESGAPNNAAEPSTDSPAPKPKPETPTERTARLTKLLRYEIHGDARRLLDTTFPYPKDIAQLDADYDKCLIEERYVDGDEIAAGLIRLLREQHTQKTDPNIANLPTAAHILLNAWRIEHALCQGAAKGKPEADTSRRRGLALTRLSHLREMSETWTSSEVDRVVEPGAASPLDNSTSVAYLLLRALKSEERQPALLDDEVTPTVNAVLDRVTVSRPVWVEEISIGSTLNAYRLPGVTRTRLKDLPEDALLMNDLRELPGTQTFALTPVPVGTAIRRSQLGNAGVANAVLRKIADAAVQERVHSTLRQLFPSETIEVHVASHTAILRASLKNAAHEPQIVSIVESLAANVLNQMTLNGDATDQAATVAEKLEPIGEDLRGLREILARLYPREHIEAHFLPDGNTVVLRGHLSRPEYARQVHDVAETSGCRVLYQMTPALPPRPNPIMAAPRKASVPQSGSPNGGLTDEAGNRMTMVMRLMYVGADEAVRVLRPKFSGNAVIVADVQTNSLIFSAEPVIVNEIKAAVATLDVKEAKGVASTVAQEAALDREARQLATKFRTAKLDEQPALRRQLEQLTERHFEQRQQRRQSEIEDLAHRVDVLRVTHHRRQENKTAVIQQRVQDLLDPNADLRWDEPQRTQSEGSGTGSHQREATDSSRKKSASMPKDRP